MKTADLALLDTNILIYCHQALSKFDAQSRNHVMRGLRGGIALCICPQVLMEIFSVITNLKRGNQPGGFKGPPCNSPRRLRNLRNQKAVQRHLRSN